MKISFRFFSLRTFLIIMVLLVALVEIFHVAKEKSSFVSQKRTQENIDKKTKLFNPENQIIKKIIYLHVKKFPGIMGIAFKDINSLTTVYYNGKVSFPLASIVKVPILLEVFQQFHEGKLNPNSTIKLEKRFKVGGSGKVKDLKEGTLITLRQLAEWMITISDNTATDILISRVGMDSVNKFVAKLGLSGTTLKRTIYDFNAIDKGFDNLTTPLDMCKLLSLLYEGKVLPEPEKSQILEILAKQKHNHLIPKFLPEEIKIAHKTGELNGIMGDCGIVYLPAKPYILCIFGKNITDMQKAEKIMAVLSRDIFLYLTWLCRKPRASTRG